MRIFLDTNILMDSVEQRKFTEEANVILSLVMRANWRLSLPQCLLPLWHIFSVTMQTISPIRKKIRRSVSFLIPFLLATPVMADRTESL